MLMVKNFKHNPGEPSMAEEVGVALQLKRTLSEFERISGAYGSAVVTTSGLLVASTLPEPALRVAAMAASLLGAAERATSELAQSTLNFIIVEAEGGKNLIRKINDQTFFLALARPEANVGLILVLMERTAEKIRGILG